MFVQPRGGFTIWITGMQASGKSTLASAIVEQLRRLDKPVELLEGEEWEQFIGQGPGETKEEREALTRRSGFIARAITRAGGIAVVVQVSPSRELRDQLRREIGRFLEVFVDCEFETLLKRDKSDLYRRALKREVLNVIGVDYPYDMPMNPDVRYDSAKQTPEQGAAAVIARLNYEGALTDEEVRSLHLPEVAEEKPKSRSKKTPVSILFTPEMLKLAPEKARLGSFVSAPPKQAAAPAKTKSRTRSKLGGKAAQVPAEAALEKKSGQKAEVTPAKKAAAKTTAEAAKKPVAKKPIVEKKKPVAEKASEAKGTAKASVVKKTAAKKTSEKKASDAAAKTVTKPATKTKASPQKAQVPAAKPAKVVKAPASKAAKASTKASAGASQAQKKSEPLQAPAAQKTTGTKPAVAKSAQAKKAPVARKPTKVAPVAEKASKTQTKTAKAPAIAKKPTKTTPPAKPAPKTAAPSVKNGKAPATQATDKTKGALKKGTTGARASAKAVAAASQTVAAAKTRKRG